VGLDRTCLRIGGWQWWFFCPRCGHRRRSLYLPPDATDFSCRRCNRLLYLSQRLDRHARARLRAVRLAEQLGVSSDDYELGVEPAWSRSPRGMRRRTFQRLFTCYLATVEVNEARLVERIAQLMAKIRTRVPAKISAR
jgi:hypothetical protein